MYQRAGVVSVLVGQANDGGKCADLVVNVEKILGNNLIRLTLSGGI